MYVLDVWHLRYFFSIKIVKGCIYRACWFSSLFSASKEVHTAFISLELSCKLTISIWRDLVQTEKLVYGCRCFFDVVLFTQRVHIIVSFWAQQELRTRGTVPLFEKIRLASRRTPPGELPCLTFFWGSHRPWNDSSQLTPPNPFPLVISIPWHCSVSGLQRSGFLGYCSDWFRWVTPNMNSAAFYIHLEWQVSISHPLLQRSLVQSVTAML